MFSSFQQAQTVYTYHSFFHFFLSRRSLANALLTTNRAALVLELVDVRRLENLLNQALQEQPKHAVNVSIANAPKEYPCTFPLFDGLSSDSKGKKKKTKMMKKKISPLYYTLSLHYSLSSQL